MAEALYFDSGEHRLFGWFHRPLSVDAKSFAVVVCKPFGYEAICAHRSTRAFSEAAVALGIPTLRFDYSGSGDSSEISPGADQIAVWIQDINAAVREVQRLGGVQRVYLLGFRLGALLAVLAAERCESIAGLILIAPILNGPRFVRELRTMRLAATIGTEPIHKESGVMEVSGFLLSAATMGTIAGVDLKSHRIPAFCEVLVIDGASLPIARAWSMDLERNGVDATYRALPGMVEMLMTAPQFAAVPLQMIAAMREWLAQRRPQGSPGLTAFVSADPKSGIATPAITLIPPGPVQSEQFVERAIFLDPESMLFGIVAEPPANVPVKGIVILTNAGADYHIGASGINVLLARRWARRGYVALRMDLAGLGDSNTRPGRPDNEVFPPAAVEDLGVAVNWMQTRYGNHDISLVGLCSGAFHVMQAAFVALPAKRAIMVNPETYFWSEGQSIYGRQTVELVRKRNTQRTGLLSQEFWIRLMRGEIDVRYVLGAYSERLWLALESRLRDTARRLRIPLANDLGTQLEACGARGVRLTFVFASGEPGLDLLQLQAGISIARLRDRCRIHIVGNADHVFSKFASRKILMDLLSEELGVLT